MSKVLVDRELLDLLRNFTFLHDDGCAGALRGNIDKALAAQPAEAEGVRDYLTEFAEGEVEAKTAIEELQDALSAVTAERDRLRDAAGKAIAWLDAEQNGSGVGINRILKLCRDAENSLRAAMAAKEA